MGIIHWLVTIIVCQNLENAEDDRLHNVVEWRSLCKCWTSVFCGVLWCDLGFSDMLVNERLMLVDVDVISPHSFQVIHYPYLALIFRGITVLLTYSLQKTHMEPEMELFVLKWKRLKRRNPWGLQSRQTHDTSTMISVGPKRSW